MEENKSERAQKILQILDETRFAKNSFRLIFHNGTDRKVFEFHDSTITYLDSTELKEKFSVFLVMMKILTSDELREKTSQKLRAFELDEQLIDEKKLTEYQIRKVFSMQLSRMVQSMMEWSAVQHKVTDRERTHASRKPALPVEEMQLHLIRNMNLSTDRIRQIQDDMHVGLVMDKLQIMKSLPFNSQESIVLSKLTGMYCLGEVLQQVHLPEEKFFQSVALLDFLHFLAYSPAPRMPSARKETTAGKSAAAAPSAPEVPSPAAQEDPGDKIAEFEEMLGTLSKKNYYEVFDLFREDFSLSDLKNKYYALVKQCHPDKYEKYNSRELISVLEKISNLLNSAYEVLKDPEQRNTYDEQLKVRKIQPVGADNPSNADSLAQESFQRGKSLINSQRYGEAISHLKRALQLKSENAEYNAYLGYAMSKTPQFRRESERYFLKAIEVNPMNVSTYLHLGRMYKEANLITKAQAMFQKALEWDPDNRVATQELREIDDAGKSKSKGLLGKLFNR